MIWANFNADWFFKGKYKFIICVALYKTCNVTVVSNPIKSNKNLNVDEFVFAGSKFFDRFFN
jgi:hypothetical protein